MIVCYENSRTITPHFSKKYYHLPSGSTCLSFSLSYSRSYIPPSWLIAWITPLFLEINFIILYIGNVQVFTRILNDELYRLDVSERIQFKLCISLYKFLHGIAPKAMNLYRAVSVIEGQSLRSTAVGQLDVPHPKTSTYGRRAFSFASRSALNSLPNYLKDSSLTLVVFKWLLKTFCFQSISTSAFDMFAS